MLSGSYYVLNCFFFLSNLVLANYCFTCATEIVLTLTLALQFSFYTVTCGIFLSIRVPFKQADYDLYRRGLAHIAVFDSSCRMFQI